jgi:hypothetical protein
MKENILVKWFFSRIKRISKALVAMAKMIVNNHHERRRCSCSAKRTNCAKLGKITFQHFFGEKWWRKKSLHEKGVTQGCQIFLVTWYKNRIKCTKWTQNVPNGHKMSQICICKTFWTISTFPSKALQNVPKFEFLVLKETIWHSWRYGASSFGRVRRKMATFAH